MRVLHILSAMDQRYGGPTSALIGLAEAQQNAGLDVVITATNYWPITNWPQLDRIKDLGVQLNLFHYRPREVGSIKPFVERLVQDIQHSDIVHIHALWHREQYEAAKICKKMGKPYLFRTCGMLAPWSMQQSFLKKYLYWKLRLKRLVLSASAIHYTTHREARCSVDYLSSVPFIVEPNGIDFNDIDLTDRERMHAKWPKGDRPIVLFLGRLHPKKGIPLVIHAAKLIKNADFVIAGPDNNGYLSELNRIVAADRIADRVKFVGELKGIDRKIAYMSATVFVLPSRHENFGNTVIEALASGTPVIISDQVDLCEDLVNKPFCAVVKLDQDCFTHALRDFLNQFTNQKPTAECREFVMSRFQWSAIGNRWKEHYASLLGGMH